MSEAHITFPCGDITLEGAWHLPQPTGCFPVVIVCHPHPLYGGNMSNNVVLAICHALTRQSIAAFRFNFRGVGRSGGAYGEGIAEQEDVKAALTFVLSLPEIDAERVGLAGYSFGASVAVSVALEDQRVSLMALISPALSDSGWEQLKSYTQPKFLAAGNTDSYVPVERFQQHVNEIPGPKQFHIVPGADHFWWGYEEEVAQKASQFFTDGFNQGTKAP